MREFLTVEENLRSAMRFFGEATGTGEVRALDRTVAMYSGLEYGVFNISLLTRPATMNDGGLGAALNETALYFKKRTKRWSFWLCEDLLDPATRRKTRQICNDFGLRPISYPPGMMAPKLLPPSRPLPEIECRPVDDEMTRCAFAEITSVCFEIPPGIANAVYAPAKAWNGAYKGFVGLVDGKPVAIVAVVQAAGALGIYSLGTIPVHRRQGYGEALLREAAEVSRPKSSADPFILQSTEAGHALYRRMGFRDVTKFTVYLTR
ncbi:MAG TPA: GNAT family N-acetyltransferase [Bryobacteraceae bacterium]|jgi:GNAT superfamily N-acetyltransferase|nr:GNAT family N-acetyltransferase [Bryobacteraceae bacterium]